MQLDFLRTVVALLDAAEVPYMLTGSMASTFHSEPRMTRDVDMVIDPSVESTQRLLASLDRSRYYIDDLAAAVEQRTMANMIDTKSGWKVDFIVRKDRPFSRVEFDRRQAAVIGEIELFVATAEDTVLAKLEWRSQSESEQQFRDVVLMLEAQTLDESYLRRWARELGVEEALGEALEVAKR